MRTCAWMYVVLLCCAVALAGCSAGGPPTAIAAGVNGYPIWAKDSKSIFYTKDKHILNVSFGATLYRYDLKTKSVRNWDLPDLDQDIDDVSPDGRMALYEPTDNEFNVCDLRTGSVGTVHPSYGGGSILGAYWVDANRVLFLVDNSRKYVTPYLVNVNGTGLKKLPLKVLNIDGHHLYTVGAGMIAYSPGDNAYHIYDIASGVDRRLNTQPVQVPGSWDYTECLRLTRDVFAYTYEVEKREFSCPVRPGEDPHQAVTRAEKEYYAKHPPHWVGRVDMRTMKRTAIALPTQLYGDISPDCTRVAHTEMSGLTRADLYCEELPRDLVTFLKP